MKGNMKFLLLLAIFVSSITAAYFISGCGDDSTVIEFPPEVTNDTTVIIEGADKVIGTMQGTVRDGYNNGFLAGVTVTWSNGDSSYTTTTAPDGSYSTPSDLASGWYEFTMTKTGHATTTGWGWIPELEDLRGDDQNVPAGDVHYTGDLDVWMLPLTATVTGKVYTALPAPPAKDGQPVLAADDPTLVSVAEGVTVILDYGFDIHPDKYTATTNSGGVYTFVNVPLWVYNNEWYDYWYGDASKVDRPSQALADPWEVDLIVLPFTKGDTSYSQWVIRDIDMVPPPGVLTMPNIYVAIQGSGEPADTSSRPVVLTYNFERPGFIVTDNLVINFSKPMDTATMYIDLDGADFAYSWDVTQMVLTINPALSLIPDEGYWVEISGYAKDGLRLWDSRDNNNTWDRYLQTQQGMRFVSTNLDEYGDDDNPFTKFPLADNITVTFDMNVVLPTPGNPLTGWVVLYDTWNNREVNSAISASGATVTINPANNLESYHTYELDFRIYSALRGDYVDDSEIKWPELHFTTVNTATIPIAPTGFALNEATGWKADFHTTSINFKWNSVPGAEYYEIFAKDNHLNTDFIVVTENITHLSYLTMQAATANLADPDNMSFDLFFDDAIQTPFSDKTQITFQVRAVNTAGAGAFSSAITIGDQTPPDFYMTQTGTADNTAGASSLTFDLDVVGEKAGLGGKLEYVDSLRFVFVEMGGDPAYVLTSAAVAWTWHLDMRDGSGIVTVPVAKCASADTMIVTIWDNTGNAGVDTIGLKPYLLVTAPIATTTNFEAPSYNIAWTVYNVSSAFNDYIDLFFSYNGGTSWKDTVLEWDWWDGSPTAWSVLDTVYSTNCRIGMRDSEGGWIWKSQVFTHTGIMLTGPDSAWLADTTIYDEGGVDSTGIPLTWNFAGLDSVTIWYWIETPEGPSKAAALAWVKDTTVAVSGSTGAYTFYPPDIGEDYTCTVKISDWDADARPAHTLAWDFEVINDWVNITEPDPGEMVPGGAVWNVTWDTVWTPGTKVQIAYSVDDGTTWDTITDSTANDGTHPWSVPATTYANNTAWLQLIDKWDQNVLDEVGPFSISGIVVDSPTVGTEWLVGTGQNIRWHWVGNVGNITIYWSRDGFGTDSTLVVDNWVGGSPYAWSVPANAACSTVTFRLYGNTDDVYTESGEMTFSGVIVTSPVTGNLAQGANTTITWATIGTLVGATVDIEYKYVTSGPPPVTSAWLPLASGTANDGAWSWDPIPAPPAEQAWVKIKKAGAPTGSHEGGEFSISGVVVVAPNGGEVWIAGNTYAVTWNVINPTQVGNVTIALYKDPGSVFIQNLATGIAGSLETFSWAIPGGFTPSLAYYIRITADAVPTITDVSDTWFEIQ